ncbi:MAG TPA: ParB N-terminal domain-containing protein [Acidimicrobiales bacterium]|nr:ParB N-terminal domain-containing protein [Acidimicrobiales bacterium]
MSVAERVESATDLVSVRLDRLVPDPTNRPLTDDSPEVLALVSSVREHGVLFPLLVCAIGDADVTVLDGAAHGQVVRDDVEFGIVDGECRWRAARIVGLEVVPALVHAAYGERRQWVEASTIANLARTDLHELDQGRRFADLRDVGHTQESIADLLGGRWSQPVISRRLQVVDRFAHLPEDTRTCVERLYRAGDLKVRQAEQLAEIAGFLPEVGDAVLAHVHEVIDAAADPARRPQLDVDLTRLVKDAARLRDVAKGEAIVAASGLRDVTGDAGWESIRNLAAEVGDPLDGHDRLDCHAAVVSRLGEVIFVCTAPDTHRPTTTVTDDVDVDGTSRDVCRLPAGGADPDVDPDSMSPDDVLTQDEIAEAEKAAAARAAVSPEQQRDAAVRAARRTAQIDCEAAYDARLGTAQAVVKRIRSKTYALALLVHQIADDGFLSQMADPLVEVIGADALGVTGVTGMDEALRSYVHDPDDGNLARFATAVAWSIGEAQLQSCVGVDPADVDEATRRGARNHLTMLVAGGYTPTAAEQAILDGVDLDLPARTGESDAPAAVEEPAGDNDVYEGLAARRLDAAVKRMLAEAAALRDGPGRKSKKYAAQFAVLEAAKGGVLAAIVSPLADDADARERLAYDLHAIDLAYQVRIAQGVGGRHGDADAHDAGQAQLRDVLAAAGVPLGDVDLRQVLRHSIDNRDMPEYLRLPDVIAALDVTVAPDRSQRGSWTADHSCPACDAHQARYADTEPAPGPTPSSDYFWATAYTARYAGWTPSPAGLDDEGPHGLLVVDSVDTRDYDDDAEPGGLWYRARCDCGFIGDAHHTEAPAVVDALDHAWPAWRDQPALDGPTHDDGKLRKGAADPDTEAVWAPLCTGDPACRGAVPHAASYGGRHVVCSNPGHVLADVEADGNPVTECLDQVLADSADALADALADVGGDDRPVVAEAEWAAFVAARDALVKATKSRPKADAFEAAKRALADALVAGHPDPYELNSALAVATSTFRAERDQAMAADTYTAARSSDLLRETATAVLAALAQTGPLPADLADRALEGRDLVPEARPDAATSKPGSNRRLYVDDVLDAAGRL